MARAARRGRGPHDVRVDVTQTLPEAPLAVARASARSSPYVAGHRAL